MKNIKNKIQNNQLLRLVALFTIILGSNIFPMRMPEMGKRAAENYIIKKQQQKNKYFIHETNDINKGIWVDKTLVNDNCKSIKSMVEDIGEDFNHIPLNFPLNTIKLAFGILNNKIDINNLSLNELLMVANVFDFLDVLTNKMSVVLMKIKSDIVDKSNDKNINEQLKQLHPNMQTLLMVEPTIDYLENFIIKKNTKNRKQALVGHPWAVNAVAYSSDGTKIVSGCDKNQDNLILWNAKTHKKIKVLNEDLLGIRAIACNPNSRSFVSGGYGYPPNNLILWDISNIDNIISQPLLNRGVTSIAFSPDSKSFVAGSHGISQENLALLDISNPNDITRKQLIGHPRSIKAVAFSSNGKYIISSCVGTDNNLILWDINNLENIISYDLADKLTGYQHSNVLVDFHPDGKKFVSCDSELILWDISDINNISFKVLKSLYNLNIGTSTAGGSVNSLAFSHDGKRIALGHNDGFTLVDINDPNKRVAINKFGVVLALAFSPDDQQIVTGGRSGITIGNNLNLWTLLTDEEGILLKQLKNYNADQVRLIYTFCLKALSGEKISLQPDSEEQTIFMTLSEDMQRLLKDLFFSQGFFSGWW